MKLLLETWRKYLTEGEAGHFPWLKEIQATDDLEEQRAILMYSDRFIPVGKGSFRSVLAPRGDEDYVIKVVHDNDEHKLQMNKDDFETAKRYPFIFPKSYAHADDFSWIVTDYTPPVTKPDQMKKVLEQSFPAETYALVRELARPGDDDGWWAQWNPADPFHIMKLIMASFRADREIQEAAAPPAAPSTFTARGEQGKDASTAESLQKILAPVAGKAYQELSKVMHEFEIDKYELGRGNIGFDKDSNFKIIDSSVFSSDW